MARCAWFSPVPSQTTSGFLASSVTHPSEYDPPSSKMGCQFNPRLVVFHSPPDAVATYQTLRFRGSTATSAIRPEENVPVMLRTWRSRTRSAVNFGEEGCCPDKNRARGASKRARRIDMRKVYPVIRGGPAKAWRDCAPMPFFRLALNAGRICAAIEKHAC